MDHGVNQHQAEDPAAVAGNQRLGIWLFFIYAAIYLAYIAVCVLWTDLLDQQLIGGLVNSVVFGFGLIVLAIVVAFIYGLACRSTILPVVIDPHTAPAETRGPAGPGAGE
jgi:uncharacterized membrane protein (DUF485 family)